MLGRLAAQGRGNLSCALHMPLGSRGGCACAGHQRVVVPWMQQSWRRAMLISGRLSVPDGDALPKSTTGGLPVSCFAARPIAGWASRPMTPDLGICTWKKGKVKDNRDAACGTWYTLTRATASWRNLIHRSRACDSATSDTCSQDQSSVSVPGFSARPRR